MTKRQWISIAIIIAVILGLIFIIKYVPVWLSIMNFILFGAGFASGFLINKKKQNADTDITI